MLGLWRLVSLEYFIPIHGEYRHLSRHARLAIEEGIPEENVVVATNGDVIEITADGIAVREQIDAGKVYVHGKGVGDIGRDVFVIAGRSRKWE